MLRRIDPALLPGELVPRRGQSAPERRNKEALPENPEVMSTMAPSASVRRGLSLFLPTSLSRMRKEHSNSPRPETAPPPLLGFQKQKALVPFGLSSGSCSSLDCFHFLHSTRHPEKMTHIRIRIFSVSQNLRKVGYPSLLKPGSGNLSLHQREKHGLSHPFCLRQEGWSPCHMLTSLMQIKEVFGATGKFYFQENFSTKARFYFMRTYSIPTLLLHRCFLRKSLRGKKSYHFS